MVGAPLGAIFGDDPSLEHSGSVNILIPRPQNMLGIDIHGIPIENDGEIVKNGDFQVLGGVEDPLGAVFGGVPILEHSGPVKILIPRPQNMLGIDIHGIPIENDGEIVKNGDF